MRRLLSWILFIGLCVLSEIILALSISFLSITCEIICGGITSKLFHILYWPFFLGSFTYIKKYLYKIVVGLSEAVEPSYKGTRYILLPVLMIIKCTSQIIYGLKNTIPISDISTLILCLYLYLLITRLGLILKLKN